MAYDPSYFEGLRNRALADYSTQSAMNAYRRYLAETAGQRGIQTIQEAAFGQRREVPRLTSSFARRGLTGKGVRSGLYNKALSDYATQRAQRLGQAQENLASQLRGYDLTGAGLRSQYEQTLADIERRRAQAIAEDAATLSGLK